MSNTKTVTSADKATVAGATFRLVYRSRSLLPAGSREADLGAIFRGARTKNARLGITGALVLYDDWFAQALEGDETAVRTLYARIEKDPRHNAVEVIEAGPAGGRVFARWAMAKVGEQGEPDIPLIATTTGVAEAAARPVSSDQEKVLKVLRDATVGYGRGY